MIDSKKKPTKIVALDYGLARIGVAISDELKIIATPITTLKTAKKTELTISQLLEFLEEHQKNYGYEVQEIIVGLPLLLSGKSGLLADEVKHFVDLLQKSTPIPIKVWDERLTSVQAERSMKEGNLTRKKRSKLVDKVAGVILLQSYLDHLHVKKDLFL